MNYPKLLTAAVKFGWEHSQYTSFSSALQNSSIEGVTLDIPTPPSQNESQQDGHSFAKWLEIDVAMSYPNEEYSAVWFGWDSLNMDEALTSDPHNIESAGLTSIENLDSADPIAKDYLSIPLKSWFERAQDSQILSLMYFGWPAYISFQLAQHRTFLEPRNIVIGDHDGIEFRVVPETGG